APDDEAPNLETVHTDEDAACSDFFKPPPPSMSLSSAFSSSARPAASRNLPSCSLRLSKYLFVWPSTSFEAATQSGVSAPFAGVTAKSLADKLIIDAMKPDAFWLKSVFTKPGAAQLTAILSFSNFAA